MHAHDENRVGAMGRSPLQPSVLQNLLLEDICIRSHYKATLYDPHETKKKLLAKRTILPSSSALACLSRFIDTASSTFATHAASPNRLVRLASMWQTVIKQSKRANSETRRWRIHHVCAMGKMFVEGLLRREISCNTEKRHVLKSSWKGRMKIPTTVDGSLHHHLRTIN